MFSWHKNTATQLLSQYNNGRLHHAIMLVSIPNIGVDILAQYIAKGLLCSDTDNKPCGKCKSCLLFDASSHPDFHMPTTDKKQLGVDAIRQVMEKVNQTAQLGGNKVVVVNQIENMTEAASNAFLKTLEEPTQDTYMLLTTEALDRLLPTIVSRCEKHKLAIPTYQQCQEYLSANGVDNIPSENVFISCGYSPLTVSNMQSESSLNIDDFKADLKALQTGQGQLLSLCNKYSDQTVDVLNWLFHESIRLQAEYIQQSDQRALERMKEFIEVQHAKARKRVHQNGVNQTLLLNQVLLMFLQLNQPHQN